MEGSKQVVIGIKLSSAGEPERFYAKVQKQAANIFKKATAGTHTWNKSSARYSFPLDPTLIRNLAGVFGEELEFDDKAMAYLDILADHQQEVIDSVKNYTPVHPKLRDYQNGSVHFLASAGKAILGHDTGIGKTPISCVAIDHVKAKKVLIVCLNTLKWNWADHLSEWSVLRNVIIVESAPSRGKQVKLRGFDYTMMRGTIKNQHEDLVELMETKKEYTLIMNYTQMRLHRKILTDYGFDVIIADESHKLNNRKAQQTQAWMGIAAKAKYAWMLTGTPVRKDYDDLFCMLSVCDQKRFPGYWNFVKSYMLTVRNFFGGVDVIDLKDEQVFNRMLSMYMYRELKADVRKDLPPKLYSTIRVPMTDTQEKLYKQMEKEMIMHVQQEMEEGRTLDSLVIAPNMLAQQMRLRQICLNPALIGGPDKSAKLSALEELLENFMEENRQVLVFTMFRQMIPYIEHILEKQDIPYDKIVGGMKLQELKEVEERFRAGKTRIIVGTIQAMGEGLNLQEASVAIFMDQDWVPATNSQAEDRIHRGDISESPYIVKLYHPDTVESDILLACKLKEKIANRTIGQVEVYRSMLSRHGLLREE